MYLHEFVQNLPWGERDAFRERLALAHQCSVSLVKKWEADSPHSSQWDQAKKRALIRRHPSDLASIELTENLTNTQVTRHFLRPECWPLPKENAS